jgi:hypothetical protein
MTDIKEPWLFSDSELDKVSEKSAEEFLNLANRDSSIIGRIIKCHLLVEFYMSRYLERAAPALHNWDDARLSFNQKFTLLNSSNSIVNQFSEGISLINKLRNRIAHTLQDPLQDVSLEPLKKGLEHYKTKLAGGNVVMPPCEGIELVEYFTLTICSVIDGASSVVQYEPLAHVAAWMRKVPKTKKEAKG